MPEISRRRLVCLAAAGPWLLAGRADAAPTPLDTSGFVRIGGIEQWISVRGTDPRNPVILYLHGGPGEAQSPFLGQFLPWETDYTVVNWDQRGAGKTYGRTGAATPDMTVNRLIDDAVEVATQVSRRLSQRKVILVGQSFGSFLGANVIRRAPHLFHAFVGTGQLVSLAAALPYRSRWARQQATAAGDQASLKALDDAEAAPADSRDLAVATATNKWAVSASDQGYAAMVRDYMSAAPDRPDRQGAADWVAGANFSGPALMPAVRAADLRAVGLDMPVPFFVIHGRDDHITPPEPAKAYVDDLRAPAKAFVLIDGGHYACFTRSDQFLAAMRKHVRPLAA